MTEAIGFIGLGNLGQPMAANLLDCGHALRVYNRTAEKADALVARGAQRARRPADAVPPGGVVATLLWDDDALEAVVHSPDFLAQLAPGGLHLSMSTVAPDTARRLADVHARHGSRFVQAPLFGRPQAAVAGALRSPVAGAAEARERAGPVLHAMGVAELFDFGEDVGMASIVKLVGNVLIVSAGYGMREALSVAEKNGVDAGRVVEMLTQTLFPGAIYQGYGRMIADGAEPFGDSAIPRKDVALMQQLARQTPSEVPLTDVLCALLKAEDRN